MSKLKTLYALVAAAGFGLAATTAQAAYVVDGWQLDTTNSSVDSLTTNIGHLNLSGGGATVIQQVDAFGNPFVGAQFSEFGLIFSTTYTVENVAGAGDFGLPADYNNDIDLRFRFVDLGGVVTGISGSGAITYAFTPGVGDIFFEIHLGGGVWETIALLEVVAPSGGDLNDFGGSTGTNGNSTITAIIASAVGVTFKDSAGVPFDLEDIFLDTRTNNEISSAAVPAPCPESFGPGALCAAIGVTSNGSTNLLRVPEPATLGLLGVSLIGLAFARRRREV